MIASAKSILSKLGIFNVFKSKIKTGAEGENSTQKETTPKIQEPIFPTQKFISYPTLTQRDEYVNELLKYINSTPDTKLQLKALGEIEKYGISDVDYISIMLLSDYESVIREK